MPTTCYHGYELPHPFTIAIPEIHGRFDCPVFMWVGLNKPLPVAAIPVSQLCDQSCTHLESDLLNWESLRSQCQCLILWMSTNSPAWHTGL